MDTHAPGSTSPKLWREAAGPLLTLSVAAAIELLSRTAFKIPNPPAFLLLMVVFAAFRGGLRSGLISATVAWAYIAYYFSLPQQPFHYTDENLRRVVVWLATTPAIALLVGLQQRHIERMGEARTRGLQETSTFLEYVLATSPGVVYQRRPTDAAMTYVSPNVQRVLGYAPEEIIGVPWFWQQHVHPDDRAQIDAQNAQAWAERRPQIDRVYRFLHKDGSYRWLHNRPQFEYDEAGHLVNTLGFVLDITHRKHAEEETRRLQIFLTSIVENIPNMIFVKRAADLRFVLFNKAGEDLLGHARNDLIGKNDYDFFPKEEADFFTAKDREVLEGRTPQDIAEESIHTKHHGDRILHTKKIPLFDDAGSPQYLLGISEDITDRKQTEKLLQQAKEEADEANRGKSEFLSRMSHELRTPLNAILGFAQLLEMDSLNPEQRESVVHILKGGRHLLDLINEVLDIARIEAGRLALSLEPVSLKEVVLESLDLIGPLASEGNIRLQAGAPAGFVRADRQRLKQVLLNLLSNAVKYNRRNGRVALSFENMPPSRLRIKISDTGPGIAPERLERLFVPFDRLGAEQSGVEGTGLGLALSKRLVEAMGGTIGVESLPGQGSSFWVDIAQSESPVQRLDQMGVTLPAAAELDATREARIVLYIEDNLSNLKLIQRILAHRPEVRLVFAMQGRLGLDLARQHRPHLIFLDLHLPDIPGEEILQRLQADPETRAIPVVMVSADAIPSQIKRLRAEGARDYLTKPLDVKRFLTLLDDVFADRAHDRIRSAAESEPQQSFSEDG